MHEEWRTVDGFPGYDISNLGRLRRATDSLKHPAGTVFTGNLQKNGYLATTLSTGTVASRKRTYLHHLVAEAFLGPRPSGWSVNHIDGCKTNNRADNLEYLTLGDNTRHAFRTGLCPRGEHSHNAVLSDDIVTQMRKLAPHQPYRAIAKQFGVTPHVAYAAIAGITWRHVAEPPLPRGSERTFRAAYRGRDARNEKKSS